MVGATKNQFECVLKFIAIFGYQEEILKQSPDYIIEKYERFIGPIGDNMDQEILGGIHPILQQQIIDKYIDMWKPIFKT